MAYISRDDAVSVLYELINSPIISKELEENLQEIANCIESEKEGYHLWGADDDAYKLHVAYREDLWTPELTAEIQAISDAHSFTPAPYEADEIG